MSNPRELPILFNAAMVRAILAGTKTQTRRPFKQQPPGEFCTGDVAPITDGKRWAISRSKFCKDGAGAWPPGTEPGIKPQYRVGDKLYVQEDFMYASYSNDGSRPKVEKTFFKADNWTKGQFKNWQNQHRKQPPVQWQAAEFMSCNLSRIWLEVVDVRVERVQDIDEVGAMAEGIREVEFAPNAFGFRGIPGAGESGLYRNAKMPFQLLWDSIYKNWDKNPWVFVYEFKVVK